MLGMGNKKPRRKPGQSIVLNEFEIVFGVTF